MWIYQKTTQYPVKVSRPNPRLAKLIITQYGGPDCMSSARGFMPWKEYVQNGSKY